ncbi:tyrosine-type recombinase/integrase [Planctomicrobium sp. SH661]|uniref:tyrosine-type recombinase/integrase n=1 Tax=Planctomicrobium sp. SH661 TaxID=3448124 RepID=UPI003F5B7EA4
MSERNALAIKYRVETLLASNLSGTALEADTAKWTREIDDSLADKLARVGLIPKRTSSGTITTGDLTKRFIASNASTKESTKIVWRRCQRLLVAYFGEERSIDSITVGDARDFREWMLREGNQKQPGTGLEENTVRKMCSVAAQFFGNAIDREWLLKNPFAVKGIPRTVRENRSREFIVTPEMAEKVLAACPDAEWRLIFALSRYGGLRCPSEHMALRWSDVLWDRDRIIVTAPKTEHHEGKGTRVIPIFPELRPHLEQAFDEAEPGTEFLINRYRSSESNLRTQLNRIIRRAGLTPWAKPFHTLRATRETELAHEHPIHVVCEWIGNSMTVAARHYLSVTETDFRKAAQNPAQYTAVYSSKDSQLSKPGNEETPVFPGFATRCKLLPRKGMDVTGLEPVTSSV